MADLKITELAALASADLVAGDFLAVADISASETKKITVTDFTGKAVTLIADATIPGAKILFGAGDVPGSALANSSVTAAKIVDDAVTAAKLADESSVDLVTTLPASGAFIGQLALDTDDYKVYCWDGSVWRSIKAAGSINTVNGDSAGVINIVVSTSGDTVNINATLDNTAAAAQFLAGPSGSSGAVSYRTIVGADLPAATSSTKGGVVVNGNGLTMSGDTITVDNTVASNTSAHHLVQYTSKGLITAGRAIQAGDLPLATSGTAGAAYPGSGLNVDVNGRINHINSVTGGTYAKVTVDAQGHVSAGASLTESDIPNIPATKLTSGTLNIDLFGTNSITGPKLANYATIKFGGASSTQNVVTFPTADYTGQMFFDATNGDLYLYTGSSWQPITITAGELIYAGTYNANTNTVKSVTAAGTAAGLVVNAALPPASNANLRYYVVVSDSGNGTAPAPAVALAPPDMIVSGGSTWELIDVSSGIAGQLASNISFTPSGDLNSTNVQTAIQELDSEKLPKAGGTVTGNLEIGATGSLTFEGSTANAYETTLAVTDPTADRTITLPDQSGNVLVSGNASIVDADINASAEIAVSKLADGAARQLLQTDAAGTGVEWTSNVDLPGTLDVTGAATFDSTVSIPVGTAAAPNIYFGTDTNTGVYSPSADQVSITTGGTERFRVDSNGQLEAVSLGSAAAPSYSFTTDANTGIYSPGADQLAISTGGVQRLTADTAAVTSTLPIVYPLGAAATPSITFTGDLNTGIYSPGADQVAISTGGSGRLFVDSSGRVGVNNPSPGQRLHVYDASASNVFTRVSNASAGYLDLGVLSDGSIYGPYSSPVAGTVLVTGTATNTPYLFYTNGSERLRITSAGLVGVGTSSPSSLLHVQSSADGEIARFQRSGGTNLPILRFNLTEATPDVEIEQTGAIAGAIGFKTGAQRRMTITSAGLVGIGVSSPQLPLTIGLGGGANPAISGSTQSSGGIARIGSSGAAALDIGTLAAGPVWLQSTNVTNLATNYSLLLNPNGGNVGIGTASPANNLEVSGSGTVTVRSITTDTSGGAVGRIVTSFTGSAITEVRSGLGYGYVLTETNHPLLLGTNATERARIDSSGRLLVGTSSALEVSSGFSGTSQQIVGSDAAGFLRYSANNNPLTLWFCKSRNATSGQHTIVQNGDGISRFNFQASDGVKFLTAARIESFVDGAPGVDDMPGMLVFSTTADGASSPTERMRINAAGDLIYGTGGNGFDAGSGTTDGLYFNNTNKEIIMSRNGGVLITLRRRTSDGTIQGFYRDTTLVGTISVTTTATAYNTSSDYRLKENVTAVTDGITRLQQLKPSRFNFIADPSKTVDGFLAHEAAEVVPECVTGEKDEVDDEGNPIYQGIDQSKLVPLLTAALQEAITKIESLEARLDAANL